MVCCEVCEALEIAINKCKKEIESIERGTNDKPRTDSQEALTIWYGIVEERHEYLEGFQSRLEFLLNNPNRKKLQV